MINILIKTKELHEIVKTVSCNNIQQAEILMEIITFDKEKYYSEIDRK